MHFTIALSLTCLSLLLGNATAAPMLGKGVQAAGQAVRGAARAATNPLTARPAVGAIVMAAPKDTHGGVQLGGAHIQHPHIVTGHDAGPHGDVHVSPVSHTNNAAFKPHMPTTGLHKELSGNVHLNHVTAPLGSLHATQGKLAGAHVSGAHVDAITNNKAQHAHNSAAAAHGDAAHEHTNAAAAHRQEAHAQTKLAKGHTAEATKHKGTDQAKHDHHTTEAAKHTQNAATHVAAAQDHGKQAQDHRAQAAGHRTEASNHGTTHAPSHQADASRVAAQTSAGAAHTSKTAAQTSKKSVKKRSIGY